MHQQTGDCNCMGLNPSLANLNNDLKIYIFQYLQISDYASLSRTCKVINEFCSSPSVENVYWRTVYQNYYSSKALQAGNLSDENPWKSRIKTIEEKISQQKIFSNKFRVCVEMKCEKLGSLTKEISKITSTVLTVCLRDLLIKQCELSNDEKLELAKKLLDNGANPLEEINVYLEDLPLRIAVLKDEKEMVGLFIKYIDKNEENKIMLKKLINQTTQNSANSVLDKFSNSF